MLLWIIAKLLIHFLFAIIWEMKNMLFYMLLFHIFKQWGMLVTNVEQGKNNTFTFPIAFKNNLYFYWAFDCVGYFYNLIIKNKDINSCYIYGVYPNGTEQTGELAPTGVSGISVFIGS